MIDVHFHCLPGLDDGPQEWSEAVALCREAAAQGTTSVVATPHVLRDAWLNEDQSVRDRMILRLNALLAGKPSVLAGCEYYFSSDAVEQLERGRNGPLTGLNRSRYLLLEFPTGPVPRRTASIFHEFSLLDVTPVIAHPERNRFFVEDPRRLEDLVARGAVVQLTAASLLGDFGETPRDASEEFFRRGLVHVIASDAHSLDRRPPRLSAARAQVRQAWGQEAELGLFESNPAALIQSEPLPWNGSTVRAESART